jgi:tetratricopeptide (TPR) repeat protein
MEYQEYVNRSQQASQFIQSGRLKEAEDALYQLILSDISDLDKAATCVDLATVYDRMGKTDEALAWYDKGVAYEQMYCRYEMAEKRAQYLSLIGRSKDAVPIYEALIKQPFISEAEKERMRKIIQTLLGKAMRQWQS